MKWKLFKFIWWFVTHHPPKDDEAFNDWAREFNARADAANVGWRAFPRGPIAPPQEEE